MEPRGRWLDEVADAELEGVLVLVLDAEGCLTDGLKFVSDNGDVWLRYSAIDGLGVWLLTQVGMKIAIVSASGDESIRVRAKQMGASLCALDVIDKADFISNMCVDWETPLEAVCVMGDDLWDIGAMQIAGVSVCPYGARPEVLSRADFRTRAAGGKGAVRELADRLLAAKGLTTNQILALLR